MNAKVSVILPSLNVAAYIRECLESVVNQSLRELEIICIDAGSTDGTEEILKKYAAKDSRITLLRSNVKSYGRQVNMGLDYAKGEYVAVLETDDWIAEDMYRRLYNQAVRERLDYAAADFETFFQLQNGYGYFTRQHIFPDRKWTSKATEKRPGRDWYGKVLGSEEIAALRSSDYTLWRGIYNREFLNVNKIRFHESLGAAFQDMGFLQQVKTCAERAEYLDESFYRYRQGREAASSACLEGLRYYEGEFRWLHEQRALLQELEGDHKRYYYLTMSIAFLSKYEQVLSGLRGDWQDERLARPYGWFQQHISHAVDSGLLNEKIYGEGQWERLTLLLSSQENHARMAAAKEKEKEKPVQEFLAMTNKCPVVIFGCGIRGERLMLFCDRNQVKILGFSDNNRVLQGRKKFGFPVIPPEELADMAEKRNLAVVLSMKEGAAQVRGQLVKLGMKAEQVIDRLPAGIFNH